MSGRCQDQVVKFQFLCKPSACICVSHMLLRVFPQALMSVRRIEKLFMNQRRWERGAVGSHCLNEDERKEFFEKQQFVLQFFLGFLKINPLSREHHFGSLNP